MDELRERDFNNGCRECGKDCRNTRSNLCQECYSFLMLYQDIEDYREDE